MNSDWFQKFDGFNTSEEILLAIAEISGDDNPDEGSPFWNLWQLPSASEIAAVEKRAFEILDEDGYSATPGDPEAELCWGETVIKRKVAPR